MKTGDTLYFPEDYTMIIDAVVTKVGPEFFEIDKPIRGNNRFPLTHVGEACFMSHHEAEKHQDHVNAASAFLGEVGAFQRLDITTLIKNLNIEEIQLRRAQNQELFRKTIRLAVVPGDTVRVLWSSSRRKDETLRRNYGEYLKAGTLVKVLAIGPFLGSTTALRVELADSEPRDVFYISTGDVGKV